jgi:hypothetical protein
MRIELVEKNRAPSRCAGSTRLSRVKDARLPTCSRCWRTSPRSSGPTTSVGGEHLTEGQVIELVIVIATANWTNRVNDGLQTPLPPAPT